MGYCVGNCLSWDSVSGNLTINEDPLGGLECLPGGQRIRIAGGTTGVAVNAKNNGLFMTTAGELATKVNPQVRNFSGVSGYTGVVGQLPANVPLNYGITTTLSCANPSAIYSMYLTVDASWFLDAAIFPNTEISSGIQYNGVVSYNGVASVVSTNKQVMDKLNAASNGRTNVGFMRNWSTPLSYVVAPGTTSTIFAYHQLTGLGTSAPEVYQASTSVKAFGIIGEFI